MVTPLEMWLCTDHTESTFEAHRDKYKITVKSSGSQAMYEDEKFKVANQVFPGRWGQPKNFYMKCVAFRRDSQRVIVPAGDYKDTTLWDTLEQTFLEHGDFTSTEARAVKHVVLSADVLLRVLKDADDGIGILAIVDILLMMIPTHQPICTCSLLPNGVGRLEMAGPISDAQAKQLLVHLSGTNVFEKMQEHSKQTKHQVTRLAVKQQKEQLHEAKMDIRRRAKRANDLTKKKLAKTPAAKATAQAALRNKYKSAMGVRLQRQRCASVPDDAGGQHSGDSGVIVQAGGVEVLGKEDASNTMLVHIFETEKYLVGLDVRQAAKARALRYLALKANIVGSATIIVQGLPRVFKGWYSLRMAFRADITKKAKLIPRPSDEAWTVQAANGEADPAHDDEVDIKVAKVPESEQSLQAYFEASHVQDTLKNMAEFFTNNKINQPATAHFWPARCVNTVMLELMQLASEMSADAEINRLLTEKVMCQLKEHMLQEWDEIILKVDCARQLDLLKLGGVLRQLVPDIVVGQVSMKLWAALRAQAFLFIAHAVGGMKFLKMSTPEGGASRMPAPSTFLHQHCLKILGEQLQVSIEHVSTYSFKTWRHEQDEEERVGGGVDRSNLKEEKRKGT